MGVLNTEATRDPQKDDNKVENYSSSTSSVLYSQITVTVPITLMSAMSESGQEVYAENHIHKIFTSISSSVEDVSVRHHVTWIP